MIIIYSFSLFNVNWGWYISQTPSPWTTMSGLLKWVPKLPALKKKKKITKAW